MTQKNLSTNVTCKCGSRDFDTNFGGRTVVGRQEYYLTCRRCKEVLNVGKSTYALYRYLGSHKASDSFLKLFDLG